MSNLSIEMSEKIEELIKEYPELLLYEVVGVLELAKMQVVQDAMEEDAEE
jgi:hypothetical protein